MADRITFQTIGIQETIIAIRGWGEAVQAEAKAALRDEVNYAVADMRQKAPVGKTGNLLAGLARVDYDPMGVTASIRGTAPHTHLVEWPHRIVGRKNWSYDYHTREVVSTPGTVKRQGDKTRQADPSFFVVPAMRARERFYRRMKAILGHPIRGLDVTPEVRET